MAFHSTLTLAITATLFAGFLPAQEQTPEEAALWKQIRAKRAQIDKERGGVFRSVTVNGKALSPEAIRRETIFLVGSKKVEAKIADFFIQEHLAEAIKGGRDPKEFEITEKEIMASVATVIGEFQKKNPGIEFWEAVRAQFGLNKDAFLQQQRQTKLFDRVFFPGVAKDWPVITKEAIMASASQGDGKQFWENLEKASTGEDGKAKELPAFWMHLCRGWVQKQLKQWSDIRYPADGLPAEICLQVNGKDWKTADAFEFVKSGIYAQDIERAMTEVTIREVLRQELVKGKAFLTDEDFRKEFDVYREPFDSTPFTTEVIATAFKGYPSLEAFRQRWRLIRSYEKMIETEITEESLQAHADKFARFFADGQTNIDVIQFLARDQATGAWVPGGLASAKKRAEAAMAAIEAGESFDVILSEKGEYYANDKDKGRLGSKSLNQLRQTLRESEFNDLLQGYSVGTQLFYDSEVGKVHGPLRGPDGFFVARVNSRTPARNKVNVAEERTKELVRQDYVSHRFLVWANEVTKTAKIQ